MTEPEVGQIPCCRQEQNGVAASSAAAGRARVAGFRWSGGIRYETVPESRISDCGNSFSAGACSPSCCGALSEGAAAACRVGECREAPGFVWFVQVGARWHDLIDPVEDVIFEGQRGAVEQVL
jgi:hypothetical protein